MFDHIKKIQGKVVAFRITGEITDQEHHQIDQLLSERIAQYQRIRLFIVVKHYTSLNSAEALYEDMRMVKLHADHIDKMAVVGDRPWKETWVALFGLFSGLETQYFQIDQIEDAWQWVINGT